MKWLYIRWLKFVLHEIATVNSYKSIPKSWFKMDPTKMRLAQGEIKIMLYRPFSKLFHSWWLPVPGAWDLWRFFCWPPCPETHHIVAASYGGYTHPSLYAPVHLQNRWWSSSHPHRKPWQRPVFPGSGLLGSSLCSLSLTSCLVSQWRFRMLNTVDLGIPRRCFISDTFMPASHIPTPRYLSLTVDLRMFLCLSCIGHWSD